MDISADILAGDWERSCDAAKARPATDKTPLRTILREKEDAAAGLIANGSLSSVSGAGTSTGASGYGPGQVTAEQATRRWRVLIRLHDWLTDTTSTVLLGGRSNGAPVDATTVAAGGALRLAGLKFLAPVYEGGVDRSDLFSSGIRYV